MSQENVDLTRVAFDALNRRDWDAFLALMHEEVEPESRQVAIEGGYHAHRGCVAGGPISSTRSRTTARRYRICATWAM